MDFWKRFKVEAGKIGKGFSGKLTWHVKNLTFSLGPKSLLLSLRRTRAPIDNRLF